MTNVTIIKAVRFTTFLVILVEIPINENTTLIKEFIFPPGTQENAVKAQIKNEIKEQIDILSNTGGVEIGALIGQILEIT